MLAVIGAGAMGSALAVHAIRSGGPVTILGTRFDGAAIEACQRGAPHPGLGVPLPAGINCCGEDAWRDVLGRADDVVLAVSSAGFADVIEVAAPLVRPEATWLVATKGWDEQTLQSPTEVLARALGPTARVATLAGPALAPELVAGASTAVICAARPIAVAQHVLRWLQAPPVAVEVSDDVAGAETAAAYKNVIAVAVGICEGLAESQVESVYTHRFANARAAIFAQGLRDMARLAEARGGRGQTIFGLAGAGDLYVTCLGGRNGRYGRLLGAGETPHDAAAAIGSTVEGVATTKAALALAEKLSLELPTAEAVDTVLNGSSTPGRAIEVVFEGMRSS
jgi:glycerol-3-phosphate dehydrogenase (NAD(P)+)